MRIRKKSKITLMLMFSICVFFILSVTVFLSGSVLIFLLKSGVLDIPPSTHSGIIIWLIIFAIASVSIGTFVAAGASRIPLKPVYLLIEGMNKLAGGDYNTRIDLGNHRVGRDISKSFNTLAHELENTEMLRSDFINNFSHEFKTPIVSILGFARLLKRENLSREKEMEYLTIIEEESSRLASMATNVLNITKIENQNILTDQTEYNLSEQIRHCILLLEKKWSNKNLMPVLEFQEYSIYANEEMLKQVWINLLDNAIKFSPEGGEFEVEIKEEEKALLVSVKNNGEPIAKEDLKFIMNKFYQADQSHASEGFGIGLAVVKKIVELHKGEILISSDEEETVFAVRLPKRE